jgi:hypothetical protein
MLSKNELGGSHPYNRRLFFRVGHGLYVANPALDVDDRGEWRTIAELMGLPDLFATMGPAGDYAREWWTTLRSRAEQALGQNRPPELAAGA